MTNDFEAKLRQAERERDEARAALAERDATIASLREVIRNMEADKIGREEATRRERYAAIAEARRADMTDNGLLREEIARLRAEITRLGKNEHGYGYYSGTDLALAATTGAAVAWVASRK